MCILENILAVLNVYLLHLCIFIRLSCGKHYVRGIPTLFSYNILCSVSLAACVGLYIINS